VNGYKCEAVSAPYVYTPSANTVISVTPNPVKDMLHIHINTGDARLLVIVDLYGNEKLKTGITGNDQVISLQNIVAGTYMVEVLNSKSQKIASATIIKE
jgi:hypothetical protein